MKNNIDKLIKHLEYKYKIDKGSYYYIEVNLSNTGKELGYFEYSRRIPTC